MRGLLLGVLMTAAACSGASGPATTTGPEQTPSLATSTTIPAPAPPTTAPPAPAATAAPDGGFLPEGRWQLIAAGAGRVALGGFGGDELPAIVASVDGGPWEPLPLPPFEEGALPLDLVADGDDLLLTLVGGRSEVWRLGSAATAWERMAAVGEPGSAVMRALVRSDGAWLGAGQRGTAPAIWRSDDLAAWESAPAPDGDLGDGGITGIAAAGGAVVIVGVDGDGPFASARGPGGWARTALAAPPGAQVLALMRHGAGLVAVGTDSGAAGGLAWTSADGLNWPAGGARDAFALLDLAVLPDGVVALGLDREFASRAWISTDGLVWSLLP